MKPIAKAALAAGIVSTLVYILLPPAIDDDRHHESEIALQLPTTPPPPAAESDTVALTEDTPGAVDEPAQPAPPSESDVREQTQEAAAEPTPPVTAATAESSTETMPTANLAETAAVATDQETGAPTDLQVDAQTQIEPSSAGSEPGSPDAAQAQTIAEEAEPSEHWVEHEIRPGDSMAKIFNEFGLEPSVLVDVLDCDQAAKDLAKIRPGQMLRVRLDGNGTLMELVHERSSIAKLRISVTDDGYAAELEEKPLEQRVSSASAVVQSSLFMDGQNAGLSDKVIMAVAELFNWDIDFVRELRKGDRFSVIYESDYVDGEKYRDGAILAAEFVNKGKTYQAIRYTDPNGMVDYYNADGSAKKKAFIKTPVKFTRISSRFTNKRWHPVLKRWRAHKGVDYAAPSGTPVKAAGRGTVSFVGRQRGYGKVIILKHGDQYTTVYGHLSGYAKGLKKGQAVTQGEVIGYVGQTGLATGPHLHYEFRVNGKHVDPLSHKLPTAMPLPKKYLADFNRHAAPLVEQLGLLAAPKVAEKH